jgi:galactose mutarotase-like enzyme
MKQWPFAHTIDVTYRLQDGTLEVLTKVTNHATEPMPEPSTSAHARPWKSPLLRRLVTFTRN